MFSPAWIHVPDDISILVVLTSPHYPHKSSRFLSEWTCLSPVNWKGISATKILAACNLKESNRLWKWVKNSVSSRNNLTKKTKTKQNRKTRVFFKNLLPRQHSLQWQISKTKHHRVNYYRQCGLKTCVQSWTNRGSENWSSMFSLPGQEADVGVW